MKIDTANGLIFLCTSIGRLFEVDFITYLSLIFSVIALYKLFTKHYTTLKHIYTLLLVAVSVMSIYYAMVG